MEREDDLYAPEGEVEGETPDPLAELPDDPAARRQQIDDYLATERERIAAEARATAEAEVQQHKANLNAGARQRLMDRFGIEWGEDGEFAVKDPLRALANLQGVPAPPDPEEERPDPVYDPAGHATWMDRQIDRKAAAKVAEAQAPLLQKLQALENLVLGQTHAPAEASAREVLDAYGLGQYGEHPEFGTRFREALGNLPVEQRQNPQALELAAMSVIPFLDKSKMPRPTPTQDPRTGQFVANPARAGLQQTAPPRGYGRQSGATGGYTAEQQTAAQQAGMSVEEFVAYSSEDTAWDYAPKGRR